MKRKKVLKTVPLFASESEEARFWDRVDSTAYFSGQGDARLKMPARTEAISLRLPKKLLERVKKLADSKDVPYQSLLKVYLDEKVREEIRSLKKVA